MNESVTNDDFDLDLDSDEVADLVGYSNPADGTHIYGLIFCGMDKQGDRTVVKFVYQKINTMEKTNEGDLDAAIGSIFQESFSGNDIGQKLLKLRLSQIFGEDWKGGKFRPYIEALGEQLMSNFHLKLTTKLESSVGKKGTKNEGRKFENVRIKLCEPVGCVELPEKWEQYKYEPAKDD